jgi:hypothetical protein
MKKYLSSVAFLFILSFTVTVHAQKLIENKSVTGVCYAGKKVTRVYIPPPESFLKSSPRKGGGSITVIYSGFTSGAKTAFQFAVSILESLLPADTKFTIAASLEKINTEGVLGQSSIMGYAPGWAIDAQNPRAYYPVSLAEKIAGSSLNEVSQPDISLAINSSINWYFGTDGQTPAQKYDLVTVVLHELCHGLGFYDSMTTSDTEGSYGSFKIPMIYDTFVEDVDGKKLTDTLSYPNPSAALLTRLTGGQIYFNGPLLNNYTKGLRAKLYAPATWDPGSSVSHLDESATLRINALMTPFIDFGEAIHDPGRYTFSILGDLGWINTRFIHNPPPDTEDHLTEVTLPVSIKSDTTYNHNKVGLVYSFNKFQSFDTLYLTSSGNSNDYQARISIPSYNSELLYYFFTEDVFKRLYRSPSLYPNFKFRFYVGADTIKPVLSHTPAKYYLKTVDSLSFEAIATDNMGVDTVYVEYKVNNGISHYLGLKRGKSDFFRNKISASLLSLNGGDSVRYRIYAIDSANVPNIAVLPANGFFASGIENILSPVAGYSTDFVNSGDDFLNSGFTIETPDGFSTPGLNTKHPYESPAISGDSIEYTSMLRHPVIFNESGMLFSYNEVVLVEPGEPGSLFGSPDFYDYVVVEGSKDNGKTWFALTDGYDCRYFASWETIYNQNIVGQDSRTSADEGMTRKHTFFVRPSSKVAAGEKILVRFRLYSDPFANGWGWLIDDLKINPLIDGVEKISVGQLAVYPNPGDGIINIRSESESFSGKPVRYKIYNSMGVALKNDIITVESGTKIDISEYPSGIYFIVINFNDGLKSVTYSLIK